MLFLFHFSRTLNKINTKHQSYPKSRKLDAFEQKNMQCHSPSNELAASNVTALTLTALVRFSEPSLVLPSLCLSVVLK